MRKRYTRKYRDWSPRWKWSARETRWLEAWDLELRGGDWQDARDDEIINLDVLRNAESTTEDYDAGGA